MTHNKQPIIIISGATGTGKTSSAIYLSLKLKEQFQINSEIINFDSVQFYRDLDIASAKPSAKELHQVKHHLINVKSISEEMNASEFVRMANDIVAQLSKDNKIPIFVGGSGFYIRAFVKGMFESSTVAPQTRKLVETILEQEGSNGIRQRLLEVDPESFKKLHHNDNYRNCRALEHWIENGTKFSDKSHAINDPYDFSDVANKGYDFIHFYAFIEKEQHFPLLMERTQSFFKDDHIIKEAMKIKSLGYTGKEKSLQSIGYKEIFQYLNSQNSTEPSLKNISLDETIERIFISTRQLVKAQKTFFKKVHPKIEFNPISDRKKLVDESIQFLSRYVQT